MHDPATDLISCDYSYPRRMWLTLCGASPKVSINRWERQVHRYHPSITVMFSSPRLPLNGLYLAFGTRHILQDLAQTTLPFFRSPLCLWCSRHRRVCHFSSFLYAFNLLFPLVFPSPPVTIHSCPLPGWWFLACFGQVWCKCSYKYRYKWSKIQSSIQIMSLFYFLQINS